MTATSLIEQLLQSDPEFAEHEFQFTFNRKDIATITATLTMMMPRLAPFNRSLCESVLAKIRAHEEYQKSKALYRGKLPAC